MLDLAHAPSVAILYHPKQTHTKTIPNRAPAPNHKYIGLLNRNYRLIHGLRHVFPRKPFSRANSPKICRIGDPKKAYFAELCYVT